MVTPFGRSAELMAGPSRVSVPWPAAGSSVIFTLASVSPSLSEWLKSVAENAWSVSSSVVTVPFDAVGALLGSGVCA